MKKFLKYAVLFSVSLIAFASCEDPDTEEKLPYYYEPLAYLDQVESSMTALHCPLGIFNKAELNFPLTVKLSKAVSNNVKVKLALEVEGEGITPDVFTFDDEVTIPAGSMSAEQTVTISDWSFATSIQEAADWKIRFSITQTTGIEAAQEQGKLEFDLHKKEYSKIRPITSMDDLIGIEVNDQSGWSTNRGNNLFNGGSTNLGSSSNAELLVDMGQEYTFSGITLTSYAYAYNSVEVWYSVNGEVYDKVGTATKSEMYYNESGYYPLQGIAFFEPITARHLKLVINSSSYYPYIYGLNIIQTEAIPIVFTPSYEINGKISILPTGSTSGSITGGTIKVMTNTPAEGGYTVNLTQDDSLIEAYNAANGTSYKAFPSENLLISGAPATIEANAYKSSDITFELTGDLSKLDDENGYLVPLRLEAAGLSVAQVGGVIYVKVAVEHNNLTTNPSGPVGNPVSDYSGFSATGDGYTLDYLFNNNLYDSADTTYRTFEVDCGTELNIKSIRLCAKYAYSSSYILKNVQLELSTDKQKWSSMGTANSTEHLHWDDWDGYQTAVLIVPTKARYIRFNIEPAGNYYYGLVEVDIYTE